MCLIPGGNRGVSVLSDNQGLSMILFFTVNSLPGNILIPVQRKSSLSLSSNKTTTELYRLIFELFDMIFQV